MGQRPTVRRVTELDFWVGPEDAERYRRRKRRGTRVPLDLGAQARGYMVLAVVSYIACAGTGALVRSDRAGLRAVGLVAAAALIWAGVAAIRYVRLPVDEEFVDR